MLRRSCGERPSLVAGPPMVLEGTNGTLTIVEIRLIVNEVELEPADGSCDLVDNSDDDGDECPDFEAPPRFLDLPLDGNPIMAMTGLIPPGTYDELEFEVGMRGDRAHRRFDAGVTRPRRDDDADLAFHFVVYSIPQFRRDRCRATVYPS